MKIEIDQSGKVEQTHWATVIAVSNGNSKSLYISSSEKKKLQSYFRQNKKGSIYILRVFAALLYVAITQFVSSKDTVIVDLEYFGRDRTILAIIKEIAKRAGVSLPNIHFQRIGNTPKVHYIAYKVFKKDKRPDVIVSANMVIQLLESNKKRPRSR